MNKTLKISDTAPDFEAGTAEGPIRFHGWIGNSWAVLFPHRKDFIPVYAEFGCRAMTKPEPDHPEVKIIGLPVGSRGQKEEIRG